MTKTSRRLKSKCPSVKLTCPSKISSSQHWLGKAPFRPLLIFSHKPGQKIVLNLIRLWGLYWQMGMRKTRRCLTSSSRRFSNKCLNKWGNNLKVWTRPFVTIRTSMPRTCASNVTTGKAKLGEQRHVSTPTSRITPTVFARTAISLSTTLSARENSRRRPRKQGPKGTNNLTRIWEKLNHSLIPTLKRTSRSRTSWR